jgi:hypothetical protein
VGAYGSAAIELTGFVVARSALCGVQVATGGTIDLHDGVIAENPIGANIQSADFDPRRLTTDVAYRDNDRNLDSNVLPVPATDVPEVMGIGGVE